jgi:predicted enzyme related to lactoylglutathione lyase
MNIRFALCRMAAVASIVIISTFYSTHMDAQTSATHAPAGAAAQEFKLVQIDMAVVHMDKMVNFYTTVVGAKLEGHDMQGMKLYSGTMLGMPLVMAPNEIAGVVAEQSRHQFEIMVSDIEAVAANATAAGGNLRDGIQTDGKVKTLVVEDPDGNTVIFHQKI